MARLVIYVLELVGIGGIALVVGFLPWTKVGAGAVLALAGALCPELASDQVANPGEPWSTRLRRLVSRALPMFRLGAFLGGAVLLVGAVLSAYEERESVQREETAQRAEAMGRLLDQHAREHGRPIGAPVQDRHLVDLGSALREIALDAAQPAPASPEPAAEEQAAAETPAR